MFFPRVTFQYRQIMNHCLTMFAELVCQRVLSKRELTELIYNISLSTVVLNSRVGGKLYDFQKILRFKNPPCNRLYPKTGWNALVRL